MVGCCGNETMILTVGALETLWSEQERQWAQQATSAGTYPGETYRKAVQSAHEALVTRHQEGPGRQGEPARRPASRAIAALFAAGFGGPGGPGDLAPQRVALRGSVEPGRSGLHVDDDAPRRLPCHDALAQLHDVGHRFDAVTRSSSVSGRSRASARPGRRAHFRRTAHRVDTQQADSAQDERQHRGRKVVAARETARGDGPSVADLGEDGRQRLAADRVDRAGPALLAPAGVRRRRSRRGRRSPPPRARAADGCACAEPVDAVTS